MKLDRKTLIVVGAIALGIYLWYKNKPKKNKLEISKSNSDNVGGGMSAIPTMATAPVVVVPTTTTIESTPKKEPIVETKPTTESTTGSGTTESTTGSGTTANTSPFLTFDGEYITDNNVVLDFEGNID
jgi:hypothetical protein